MMSKRIHSMAGVVVHHDRSKITPRNSDWALIWIYCFDNFFATATCKKLNRKLKQFEEECLIQPSKRMKKDLEILQNEKQKIDDLIHDFKQILESQEAAMK